MEPEQLVYPMSSFTADFFGALQTTLTDNSFNNSRCDISLQNPNKSQIIRQIKQQSIQKISQIWLKTIKSSVFGKIYWESIRKYRKQQRTPLNMHKYGYKIQLFFNMKNRAKYQWAFYKLQKFTQEYDFKKLAISSTPKKNNQQIQQYINKIIEILGKVEISKNYDKLRVCFSTLREIKQQNMNIICNQNKNTLDSSKKLIAFLQNLFSNKKQLQYGMENIKQRQVYLTKKTYFIQSLVYFVNKNLRSSFLKILNFTNSNLEKSTKNNLLQPVKDTEFKIINKLQQIYIANQQFQSQKIIAQAYGVSQNNKSQNNIKQSKVSNISDNNFGIRRLNRPMLGLKFNKCFKKKDTNSIQKRQDLLERQSLAQSIVSPIIKKKSILVTTNSAKPQKIRLCSKIVKIQTQINEVGFQTKRVFIDFTYLKKSYHLPNQQFKLEIPDIQDQMLPIIPTSERLSLSRSGSQQVKVNFNERIIRIDSKKPLQFSHKKLKTKKNSSSKSRKSTIKSEQQQAEPCNIQSLKSYYFSYEQYNHGKALSGAAQKNSSTKFIGSPKWSGNKNRISTQSNIKSIDKMNPYLQQLKQKISRRPSEKYTTQKNNQKIILSRAIKSNSKSQKRNSQKQEKKKASGQQTPIITSIQQSRNISPIPKIRPQNKKTSSAQIPKQWYFYANNQNNYTSPVRSPQNKKSPNLHFQKNTKSSNNN